MMTKKALREMLADDAAMERAAVQAERLRTFYEQNTAELPDFVEEPPELTEEERLALDAWHVQHAARMAALRPVREAHDFF